MDQTSRRVLLCANRDMWRRPATRRREGTTTEGVPWTDPPRAGEGMAAVAASLAAAATCVAFIEHAPFKVSRGHRFGDFEAPLCLSEPYLNHI